MDQTIKCDERLAQDDEPRENYDLAFPETAVSSDKPLYTTWSTKNDMKSYQVASDHSGAFIQSIIEFLETKKS